MCSVIQNHLSFTLEKVLKGEQATTIVKKGKCWSCGWVPPSLPCLLAIYKVFLHFVFFSMCFLRDLSLPPPPLKNPSGVMPEDKP